MTASEFLTARGFTKTSDTPITYSATMRIGNSMIINGQPVEAPTKKMNICYLDIGDIDGVPIEGWRVQIEEDVLIDIWDYQDSDWAFAFNGVI